MNFNKFLNRITTLILTGIALTTGIQPGYAQGNADNGKKLSAYISAAVAMGYAASVLIWEVDAESGNRMSAQFSGVVVNSRGTILSAAHVVMPDKTYKVMFPDGRECIAKGLGRISIPPTFMLPDAAMLKIVDEGQWPYAELGWSSSLKVGMPCISIAYPESLEQRKPNVRFGFISSLRNNHGFVQSTCIMEPGDSGGPLFDLLGRVIGIHSGIEIPESINYEIPINTYRKYWTALSRSENYLALPADTDAIAVDPMAANLKVMPANLSCNSKPANVSLELSCVMIKSELNGAELQIYGTLFLPDGLSVKPQFTNNTVLLSKSSMVGNSPVVFLPNGETIKATVIARDPSNDLVLLLPAKKIAAGIHLKSIKGDSISISDLGRLLVSPRPDSANRFSVLGSLPVNLPKVSSYGYIGAVAMLKGDNLTFTFIQPNSAAESGGLKIGDQVLSVDGKKVEDPLDFIKALQKYLAGDTTIVTVMQNGEKYTRSIVLKYPPQRVINHPAELFVGGKSQRRDGFNQVLIHDAILKPEESGGPVFDDKGQFIGINIARISRTSTVIMPAKTIKRFMETCLLEGSK
jgi:serine protease Do